MKKTKKIIAVLSTSDYMEVSIWVKEPEELKTLLWENLESEMADLDESFDVTTKSEISDFVDKAGELESYLPLYSNGETEFGVTIKLL